MGKELPKNWIKTSVKEVSILIRGVSYKKKDAKSINDGNDFLILRGGNIQDGIIVDSNDQVFVNKGFIKDEQKIKKGDVVIVGSTGSKKLIGKAGIAQEDLMNISFGAFLMLIRPFNEINKSYFDYFFLSDEYREKIRILAGGININNIRRQYIEDMSFALPPLSEQNRIVAKLDQLFGQLELIKASLENIPQLLKDFRQQVLTQAVTGKLTNCSVKSKKLGSLLIDVKYGTSKKSLPEIDGTPIFRIPNINDGEIDDTDLKYSVLDEKEYEKLKLEENDILIIRSNGSVSLVGKTAIIRKKHIGYSYAGYLIRLRCDPNLNPEFLNYSLQSNSLRRQIVDTSRSTSGVNNINSTEIKELIIEFPVLEEQERIVFRIEQLLSKADLIETHYEVLKEKIDTLPQTILHKAFNGELVSQLASDGDAKDLLEEIKTLKAGIDNKPFATKTKKIKKYKVGDAPLRKVAEKEGDYRK